MPPILGRVNLFSDLKIQQGYILATVRKRNLQETSYLSKEQKNFFKTFLCRHISLFKCGF